MKHSRRGTHYVDIMLSDRGPVHHSSAQFDVPPGCKRPLINEYAINQTIDFAWEERKRSRSFAENRSLKKLDVCVTDPT